MEGINSELEFENHLRDDIIAPLLISHEDFELYDFKKAVDILIAKNGDNPSLYFLEVKYDKPNHGRLGFGQANGAGFQPEVLTKRSTFFEENLRWILGSEESEEYWFVDNETICQYLQGGEVGDKHNGIQKRFFHEVNSIHIDDLIILISNWLGLLPLE